MAQRHCAAAGAAPGGGRRLRAYREVVAAPNGPDELTAILTPMVVRAFCGHDRLIACELDPAAAAALLAICAATALPIAIDGWTALNAHLPPKERRGLVLIDPPGCRRFRARRCAASRPPQMDERNLFAVVPSQDGSGPTLWSIGPPLRHR
jgi:hypothetical protein